MYKCVFKINGEITKEIDVATNSAMRAAIWYGARVPNEVVLIETNKGRKVSCVIWDASNGGVYRRIPVESELLRLDEFPS